MKRALVTLLSLLFLSTAALHADAILNVDQPIRTLELSNAQIKSAIVNAALEQHWAVIPEGDGRLSATYRRSNYMAKIAIIYAPTFYTISYADSKNMRYKGTTIHPTYNRLIKELQANIVRNLKSGNYASKADTTTDVDDDIRVKLEKIKKLYDDGLISTEEYESKRKTLIEAY